MAYYYGNFLHTNYVYRRTGCMHRSAAQSTRPHWTKLHSIGTMETEKREFKRNTDQMNIQCIWSYIEASDRLIELIISLFFFVVVIGRSSLLHQKWSSRCQTPPSANSHEKWFRAIIIIKLHVYGLRPTRLIELRLRNWLVCANGIRFYFGSVWFPLRTGISIHNFCVELSHALWHSAISWTQH